MEQPYTLKEDRHSTELSQLVNNSNHTQKPEDIDDSASDSTIDNADYGIKQNGSDADKQKSPLRRRRKLRSSFHKQIDFKPGEFDGKFNETDVVLQLTKLGNIENLQRFMSVSSSLCDLNVHDFSGRTPLQIAIQADNEPMVDFLLQQSNICVTDELLHAVKHQNLRTVDKLLDWINRNPKRTMKSNSTEFPSFMTPLILANHMNNYEIIHYLCMKGFTLEDYQESIWEESIEKNRERIARIRAEACPAYLCITSEDPILDAFDLSYKAHSLSLLDPIYKEEYEDISTQSEQFAVAMLEECRTSEEVSLLLKQSHDPKYYGVSCNMTYPRLKLAVATQQRRFVTHDNCQQVLQDIWTQHHREIIWKGWISILMYLLPRILLLPLVSIGYICYPHAAIFRKWRAPIIKFTGHLSSYAVFLFLLILEVTTEDKGSKAARLNSIVDIFIWIFVFSYISDTARWIYVLACVQGSKHGCSLRFFHNLIVSILQEWWLIYEIIMELIFMISLISASISLYMLHTSPDYDNICRICWEWNDPALVSEGFFALGVVFAFGKVLYFFKAFSLLGPIQVSLSMMIYNVREMFLILVIAVIAYTSGLFSLYHYYRGMQETDQHGTVIREQSIAFSSWTNSFETLFWAMIGYGQKSSTDIILGTYCPGHLDKTCPDTTANHDNHKFTGYIGKMLYGLYHITMVIVLLNALMALFNRSLNMIKLNADIEWKFARSELWLRYFEHGRFLPNPLNLLPSVWNMLKVFRWCSVKMCPKKYTGYVATCSKEACCIVTTEAQLESERQIKESYQELLSQLIPRYLNKYQQPME